MGLLKLSSKGQLVIPKEIRDAMGLGPGTILRINRKGKTIVLEAVAKSMIDRLRGKFSGEALLEDLEQEHRREIRRERRT